MKQVHSMRNREPVTGAVLPYVLFIAALALLFLERRAPLTPFEHTVALLGIVMLFFVMILVWLSLEERKWR